MTIQELEAFLETDKGRKAYADFTQGIREHYDFLPKSVSEFWDHETFADFEKLYERRKTKDDRRADEIRRREDRRKSTHKQIQKNNS